MPSSLSKPLRILHLSDTHNWHRSIERTWGPLPLADIVIFTGDITNRGDDQALADFNKWAGEVRKRYGFKHFLLVLGNHDWIVTQKRVNDGKLQAANALNYLRGKLSNVHVLHHELVEVDGLKIFGSGFDGWQSCSNPDVVADKNMRKSWRGHGAHRYAEIPHGTHIVLTHVPAAGIFDSTNGKGAHWGSSKDLLKEIRGKKCLAHFFGHLHEQRGVWLRSSRDKDFSGGVEFTVKGKPFPTRKPTRSESSCLLISCNAMASNQKKDGLPFHIAGAPRLIIAEPSDTLEGIRFRVVKHGSKEYSSTEHPETIVRPRAEPTPSSEELANKLAKHFGMEPVLVKDIVLELLSEDSSCSPEDLEDRAVVMLSGMCDSSDSEGESGTENIVNKRRRL